MKGRIVLGVIGAVIGGVLLLLAATLGVPVEFGLAWLGVIVVVGVVSRLSFFEDAGVWPPEPPSRTGRGSDVSRLAWSMNTRTGIAGHLIVRRVENLLRRRLRSHGLDLDDPAHAVEIDALIGDGVRELFRAREMRRTDLERVLDALDRLPTPTPGAAGTTKET